MRRKPSHLVLFHRPHADNGVLMKRLGWEVLDGHPEAREGVSVLARPEGQHLPSRHYHDLGVLSAHLSEDHVKACEDADEVAMVVPNETRRVPVPVHLDECEAKAAAPQEVTDALGLIAMDPTYARYTGKGVTVALLDTGVDLTHQDFVGRWREGENAVSFIEGESVQDGLGHGTHCAGIVGGPAEPGGGRRYGVAPDAELLMGKVLSDKGLGSDDGVIDGIHWALERGARVISLSLGSSRAPGGAANALYEHLAHQLFTAEHGALLIAATGNESKRPEAVAAVENPAAAASVMGVAAVNQAREVAFFSGGQRDGIGEVDVAAPGVRVYSAWPGSAYRALSGTSMATPHVAGVAALYLEQNPAWSPQALWRALQGRALAAGAVTDVGSGVVQAP